jgi:hypothetical protein
MARVDLLYSFRGGTQRPSKSFMPQEPSNLLKSARNIDKLTAIGLSF